MTFAVIAVFWAFALFFFLRAPYLLLYYFFVTLPFGSFAVFPTAVTGGLTFTAGPIVALLLIVRMLLARGGLSFLATAAVMPNRMLLMFVLLAVAVTTTLFMPRLLAGTIDVIPVRGILSKTRPLAPSTQNISQLVYLTISILSVVAFAFFLRSAEMRQHALKAVCLGAAVTIGTGVLDFMSQYVPLTPLLAPFRTATYALAVDVVVLGGKRVVGIMPEASAYGALCMSFLTTLYFFRPAIASARIRDVYAPVLIVLLIVMVWLAKSTGAYVGLGLAVALAGAAFAVRAGRRGTRARTSGVRTELGIVFVAALVVLALLLLMPGAFDSIVAMIDRMVLSKASSSSYAERGMWRTVAWNAFIDSGLIGIGVGSTRASSELVSFFSSVGLAGTLAYYGFVLQTALRRASPDDAEGVEIVRAFGWSILPGLVVGFFNGSADFGVFAAFVYGLVTAVGTRRPVRSMRPVAVAPSRSA